MKSRVLLVEDDAWLGELYQDALTQICEVKRGSNADEALSLLDSAKFDLVILDLFLGKHNGIELLHELASHHDLNGIPVMVLSSVLQQEVGLSAERWQQYGVRQYLYKPETKPADLVAAVEKQLLVQESL